MRRLLEISSALALLFIGACDWTVFDEYETTAPVIAISPSDDFEPETFGQVLTAWSGTLGGQGVSRLGVTGGGEQPFTAYTGWDGQAFSPGNPLYKGCVGRGGCGVRGTEAVAGVPSWNGKEMCLFITDVGGGVLRVRCESDGAQLTSDRDPQSERGTSITALPSVQNGMVAVMGAPALDGDLGGVFGIRDSALNPVRMMMMNTEGAMRPVGGRLGQTLAAGVVAGQVRVAVGAGATGLIGLGRVDTGNILFFEGCVRSADFAQAMVMGDPDGDGTDELFVLSNGQVAVYAVGAISGGCGPGAPNTTPQQSFACEGCTTMTMGDVNGDGADELIAGAPNRTVGSEANAGAVEIFCGSVGSGVGSAPCVTLTHSTPVAGALLGTQVAAVESGIGSSPRDEPVASAPGDNRIYFFTCSGISGDTPGAQGACVTR